jgi:hypothetical protein
MRHIDGFGAVVKTARPHARMRVAIEQARPVKFAAIEMKAHPARHVGGGRSHAAGRPIGTDLHVPLDIEGPLLRL